MLLGKEAAVQRAICKAMEQDGVAKVLTFHSRNKNAERYCVNFGWVWGSR